MSNKSPIFPIPDPNNHFSDYGFDPQIDYFQVLEEAKKHKLETASRSVVDSPPHFKLQKPISKDDFDRTRKTKRRWWMTALRFFRPKKSTTHGDGVGAHRARPLSGSVSEPLYITESRIGSTTPCRTTSRPSSGPLAGTMAPTRKEEAEIPYACLRELDVEPQQRISTSAMPIYLVT
ncbi:hypothetical protein ACSBR2_031374 [Camellia fascicularis]